MSHTEILFRVTGERITCCGVERRFGCSARVASFVGTMCFLCLGHRNCHNLYHCGGDKRFGVPCNGCGGPCFPRGRVHTFTRGTRQTAFVYTDFSRALTVLRTKSIICYSPPCSNAFSNCRASNFARSSRCRLTSILRRQSSRKRPIVISGDSASLVHSLCHGFARRCVGMGHDVNITTNRNGSTARVVTISKPYY